MDENFLGKPLLHTLRIFYIKISCYYILRIFNIITFYTLYCYTHFCDFSVTVQER